MKPYLEYPPMPQGADSEAVLAQVEAITTHNQKAYDELSKRREALQAEVNEFFGHGAPVLPGAPHQPYEPSWVDIMLKRLAAHAKEKRETEYMERVAAFLAQRGLVIGRDVKMAEARLRAENIAFEEAVAKKKSEISGLGLIEFSGQNCEGPCGGWDGESHRCECGNRRVSWATCVADPLAPELYAEAY